ncbi:EamA family transporter, partial [Salmonella enterica subsp. enterica serovar Kentucky]|nr:EamA family transporter [Salmonella enterica subsp. enterica serovar Kentucky]EKI1924831.1 EamA family transporter [Salmonella enterica]EGN2709091.1 EamA family transporter [Salmonella enterica subsp. enterica serovar Kentucky]EGS8289028.1 EamA family transporter [Salmonella enterica subsp. enterica serovar Kentucky]EHH2959683.1 EamA family transporter [Salmonella enterica subsp. enterica serovar Kentucky]
MAGGAGERDNHAYTANLSPTASQVIGQLSPVGMMVASVFILKEKMRGTQVIGALMLLSGLVMFF